MADLPDQLRADLNRRAGALGEPTAPPTGLLEAARRGRRRRTTGYGALAAVAVVGLVAGGFALVRSSDDSTVSTATGQSTDDGVRIATEVEFPDLAAARMMALQLASVYGDPTPDGIEIVHATLGDVFMSSGPLQLVDPPDPATPIYALVVHGHFGCAPSCPKVPALPGLRSVDSFLLGWDPGAHETAGVEYGGEPILANYGTVYSVALPDPGDAPPEPITTTTVTNPSGNSTPTCRNAVAPACGPFRWDPAPPANAPIVVTVTMSPAKPRVGEEVVFHVHAEDPDATVQCVFIQVGSASLGEVCGEPSILCLAEPHGPWDLPAPRGSVVDRDLRHTFTEAGPFTAAVEVTSRTGSFPKASDAEPGACLQLNDPYGSTRSIDHRGTVSA